MENVNNNVIATKIIDKALTRQYTEKGNQGYLKYLKESDPDRFNEIIKMGVKSRIESNKKKKTFKTILKTLLNNTETIDDIDNNFNGEKLTIMELMTLKVFNDISKNPTLNDIIKLQKFMEDKKTTIRKNNYSDYNNIEEEGDDDCEDNEECEDEDYEEWQRKKIEAMNKRKEEAELLQIKQSNAIIGYEKMLSATTCEADKQKYNDKIKELKEQREKNNRIIRCL